MALNLKTEAEAQTAADKMAKLGPEVLVEKMVQGAVTELIVGINRDPQFGLALVVGAGGILTELLKDSATLLLPTSRSRDHPRASRAYASGNWSKAIAASQATPKLSSPPLKPSPPSPPRMKPNSKNSISTRSSSCRRVRWPPMR